jgi:hypothetical protein
MGRGEEVVDDEVVVEEEEVVGEEEPVEDDEVVVEDSEVVVGAPKVADPVYAYILGVSSVPDGLGEWSLLDLLRELRRAEAGGLVDRAKRIRRLVWLHCSLKPGRCPLYSLAWSCPLGLEKSCRGFALARRRRGRGWYRG